jgi:hypothetical protein
MTYLAGRYGLLPVLLASGVLIGCSKAAQDAPPADVDATDIMPSARFYLEEAPLRAAIAKALNGDPQAADDVFMHYTVARHDDDRTAEFWMRVAAENGNAGYMQLYALHLHEQGGETNCRRALFWLHRAAELAPELTTKFEINMQSIREDTHCGWVEATNAL